MHKWLLVAGFLALAIGLLWIGQGTGMIAWPASSFMISQSQWAWYGAALAALGAILIWRGKR
jgi:membrane protein implicated in regulation of membrane protease activity